jgi:hypothetical protein
MSKPLTGLREGLRRLVAFAESEGWTVSRTLGGHIRFTKVGRGSIFTSSTAGDHRSGLNALARLRRAERKPTQEAL